MRWRTAHARRRRRAVKAALERRLADALTGYLEQLFGPLLNRNWAADWARGFAAGGVVRITERAALGRELALGGEALLVRNSAHGRYIDPVRYADDPPCREYVITARAAGTSNRSNDESD